MRCVVGIRVGLPRHDVEVESVNPYLSHGQTSSLGLQTSLGILVVGFSVRISFGWQTGVIEGLGRWLISHMEIIRWLGRYRGHTGI